MGERAIGVDPSRVEQVRDQAALDAEQTRLEHANDEAERAVRRAEVEERRGEQPAAEIEDDIETLRADLDQLVGELDRRRHEALDVRLQLRRHAPVLIALAGGAAALVIGAALVSAARRRRAEQTATRLRNVAHALAALSRTEPDQLDAALDRRTDAKSSALSVLIKLAGIAGGRALARSGAPR